MQELSSGRLSLSGVREEDQVAKHDKDYGATVQEEEENHWKQSLRL